MRIIALGTLLAAASTAAVAFQEQQQGAAPAANAPPAPAAGVSGSAPASAPFSGTQTGGAKPSGTEIRIPGLGSLGVLPKMDFGLELLYGAADGKPADEAGAVAPNPDDLAIKGTLRRRF